MTFKEKLVILRKGKGLTQDEFAAAVGVSRQAVYKWECGQSYPEVPKLLEMKLLFTISIDELLDDSIDIPIPEKKKRKRIPKETAEKIESTVKREINTEKKPAPKTAPAPKLVYAAPATVAAAEAKPAPAPAPVAESAPAPAPQVITPTTLSLDDEFPIPKVIEVPEEEKPIVIPRIPEEPTYSARSLAVEDDEEEDTGKKVGLFGRLFGKR